MNEPSLRATAAVHLTDAHADTLMKQLTDVSFTPAVRSVLTDFLAVTLMVCVILLLHRTSMATLHSRFLRHLGYAFVMVLLFRMGRVAMTSLKALLALAYLGPAAFVGSEKASLTHAQLIAASGQMSDIQNTWRGASLMLSFLASFWFYLAWWLLRQYPSEAIPRGFYTTALGVCTGVIALAAGIVTLTDSNALVLLEVVDVGTSIVIIGAVGWRLTRLEPERSNHLVVILMGTFYLLWAMLQIPVPFFRSAMGSTFFLALMLAGFGSMVLTVLHASIVLVERPEYKTGARTAKAATADANNLVGV